MNNKEIEEMAQDIKKTEEDVYRAVVSETQAFVKTHHKYNSKKDYSLAHDKPVNERVAEALYGLGYRKIDKNSVVFSNDNAEELANLIVTSPQMQSVMSDLIKAWQKETAEKIIKDLWDNQFETTITIQHNSSKEDIENVGKAIITLIRNKLVERAKQFGVEIKE